MNSLSWFLYFASVLPDIAGLLGVTAILTFLGVSAWVLVISDTGTYSWNTKEENDLIVSRKKNLFKYVRWYLVPIALSIVATLIPSKETIYLIAGSEAGEAVVTSPEGQEILNDIHQVIKHQLGQLKGNTDE